MNDYLLKCIYPTGSHGLTLQWPTSREDAASIGGTSGGLMSKADRRGETNQTSGWVCKYIHLTADARRAQYHRQLGPLSALMESLLFAQTTKALHCLLLRLLRRDWPALVPRRRSKLKVPSVKQLSAVSRSQRCPRLPTRCDRCL